MERQFYWPRIIEYWNLDQLAWVQAQDLDQRQSSVLSLSVGHEKALSSLASRRGRNGVCWYSISVNCYEGLSWRHTTRFIYTIRSGQATAATQ
jgi:hypothetical protein